MKMLLISSDELNELLSTKYEQAYYAGVTNNGWWTNAGKTDAEWLQRDLGLIGTWIESKTVWDLVNVKIEERLKTYEEIER